MTTKLIIYKKDGTIYVENEFSNVGQANAWIDEEKTRPYWDSEFKVQITDDTTDEHIKVLSEAEKKQQMSVSPRQITTALFSLGISEEMIIAQIETLPSPKKELAKIAWIKSGSFERNAPMVDALGAMLGMDSIKLDNLWIEAGKL